MQQGNKEKLRRYLISDNTESEILKYFKQNKFGTKLTNKIKEYHTSFNELNTKDKVHLLMSLKELECMYEKAKEEKGEVKGVNAAERRLLGMISTVSDVTFYDDGGRPTYKKHKEPIKGMLAFTSAPLLAEKHGDNDLVQKRNQQGKDPVELKVEKYEQAIEDRILPVLRHFNDSCRDLEKKAFVTLPGLGCGYFAGGQAAQSLVSMAFIKALGNILEKHSADLSSISGVCFDDFGGNYKAAPKKYGSIDFIIGKGHQEGRIAQLMDPAEYGYKGSVLCNIAAWDHMAKEGNEGNRAECIDRQSDDPAKAKASNFLIQLYGLKEGEHYDKDYLEETNGKKYAGIILTQAGCNIVQETTPKLDVSVIGKGKSITSDNQQLQYQQQQQQQQNQYQYQQQYQFSQSQQQQNQNKYQNQYPQQYQYQNQFAQLDQQQIADLGKKIRTIIDMEYKSGNQSTTYTTIANDNVVAYGIYSNGKVPYIQVKDNDDVYEISVYNGELRINTCIEVSKGYGQHERLTPKQVQQLLIAKPKLIDKINDKIKAYFEDKQRQPLQQPKYQQYQNNQQQQFSQQHILQQNQYQQPQKYQQPKNQQQQFSQQYPQHQLQQQQYQQQITELEKKISAIANSVKYKDNEKKYTQIKGTIEAHGIYNNGKIPYIQVEGNDGKVYEISVYKGELRINTCFDGPKGYEPYKQLTSEQVQQLLIDKPELIDKIDHYFTYQYQRIAELEKKISAIANSVKYDPMGSKKYTLIEDAHIVACGIGSDDRKIPYIQVERSGRIHEISVYNGKLLISECINGNFIGYEKEKEGKVRSNTKALNFMSATNIDDTINAYYQQLQHPQQQNQYPQPQQQNPQQQNQQQITDLGEKIKAIANSVKYKDNEKKYTQIKGTIEAHGIYNNGKIPYIQVEGNDGKVYEISVYKGELRINTCFDGPKGYEPYKQLTSEQVQQLLIDKPELIDKIDHYFTYQYQRIAELEKKISAIANSVKYDPMGSKKYTLIEDAHIVACGIGSDDRKIPYIQVDRSGWIYEISVYNGELLMSECRKLFDGNGNVIGYEKEKEGKVRSNKDALTFMSTIINIDDKINAYFEYKQQKPLQQPKYQQQQILQQNQYPQYQYQQQQNQFSQSQQQFLQQNQYPQQLNLNNITQPKQQPQIQHEQLQQGDYPKKITFPQKGDLQLLLDFAKDVELTGTGGWKNEIHIDHTRNSVTISNNSRLDNAFIQPFLNILNGSGSIITEVTISGSNEFKTKVSQQMQKRLTERSNKAKTNIKKDGEQTFKDMTKQQRQY